MTNEISNFEGNALLKFILSEADPEGQQNSRRRSSTKYYDVILIECIVHHSPPCILLTIWIRL